VTAAEFVASPLLGGVGARHAFFTRRGGVSRGLYATLNGGTGSRDAPDSVAENRARMAQALGVAPDRFAVPYLVHSSDAVAVTAPFAANERPRCDALVTATAGLALGVTGADCGMILFIDPDAKVIGAAHAGWRGALGGVIEATVAAMASLGAKPSAIRAALGPCIAQDSYEVGADFVARFAQEDSAAAPFFAPGARAGHAQFDLKAYIGERARRAGVGAFEDLRLDTYADEARFFSFRRATHRKEGDYGRLVSAIALG